MSIESRIMTDYNFTYDQWQNLPHQDKEMARESWRRATLKELTELLTDCANSDVLLPELAKAMTHNHRTLVQCFFRSFIVPFIKELALHYKENSFDLRNEASCKASAEMLPILENTYIPMV